MKLSLYKKNLSFSQFFVLLSVAMLLWIAPNFQILAAQADQKSGESAAGRAVPATNLKDLAGKTVSSKDFANSGKPIVISFWATWCKPCLEELAAMSDLYQEWQENTGVKIVAVSIDDARTTKKVAPLVKSKGWPFEVYLDQNSDFKRALGVSNPPHTFLLDGSGRIIYEHNGYAAGDEAHLFEQIEKAAAAATTTP